MVAADAAAAAEAAPSEATSSAPTLRSVLEPLLQLPPAELKWSAACLCTALRQLEAVERLLHSRAPPEEETMAQQDTILLTWLSAYFNGLSGSQAIIHGDLLEAELTASGMVAPFVEPCPPLRAADGSFLPSPGARFGVPTNVGPEVICDTASEILRMAAACLISLYVYLNFKQGPQDLASDEVLLVYATIAISSCMEPANAAAIDAQLAALVEADLAERGEQSAFAPPSGAAEQQPAFGCAQIRWLMHYARGIVFHHMGAVHHLLGNRDRQAECYMAEQKDAQYLCKCLPAHPLGFSLFGRCAMNHQQHGVAAAFLQKGLDAAAALDHDGGLATMAYQRAAALLLGGAGAKLDAAAVQQLLAQGEAARESVLAWFPEPWRNLAADGEPDRTLVLDKLLPELERRSGAPLPAEGEVDALQGLLYVTRAPTSVPPGALKMVVAAGGSEAAEDGSGQ